MATQIHAAAKICRQFGLRCRVLRPSRYRGERLRVYAETADSYGKVTDLKKRLWEAGMDILVDVERVYTEFEATKLSDLKVGDTIQWYGSVVDSITQQSGLWGSLGMGLSGL